MRLVARFLCVLAAELLSGPAFAQSSDPASAAQRCLAIAAKPPVYDSMFDAAYRRAASDWANTCEKSEGAAARDAKLAAAIGNAYAADGRRERAIPFWRRAGEAGEAAALYELFEHHKSWERGDLSKPQLVTRAEADAALRKSADLGNQNAIVALAVRLERGEIVKRDPSAAAHWFGKLIERPPPDWSIGDLQERMGKNLLASPNPEERARGLSIVTDLARRGHASAQADLAGVLRASDPGRARELLVQASRRMPGGAVPILADMLIKGEGGPADPKRAVALLRANTDVPGVRAALGRVLLEGVAAPQDVAEGIRLIYSGSVFDLGALIQTAHLLAQHPQVRISRPESLAYELAMAAEVNEPGALDALVRLKLSDHPQFRDKTGACTLLNDRGADENAELRRQACG